jgi:hypothetical protein
LSVIIWFLNSNLSMHYANKYNLYIWPINSWNRFPHIKRCTDTTLHDQFVSDFMSCTYNDMINTATIHLDQSHVTRNGGLFQISHAATYQKKGGGQLLRDVILIRLENYWPSSTWFYRAHNAIDILNTSAYLNTLWLDVYQYIFLLGCSVDGS